MYMRQEIVITDKQKFIEIVQRMEATLYKLSTTLERDMKNIRRIDSTEVWTGKSQAALCEKYSLLEKNFGPIQNSLSVYIRFLKKVLTDYVALEQRIDRRAEEQSAELDVNS